MCTIVGSLLIFHVSTVALVVPNWAPTLTIPSCIPYIIFCSFSFIFWLLKMPRRCLMQWLLGSDEDVVPIYGWMFCVACARSLANLGCDSICFAVATKHVS